MPRFDTLAAAAALAVLAIPLFFGLGRTDLDGDEAIYAGVVERMVAGGPWPTPPDEHGPFLEKPPLRSWIVAAVLSAGVVRPTETGHRLVDTILSACAILYVFAIARRLGGLASGVGAVFLIIATEPLLFAHGLRSGTMEPLLVLSYCGAAFHVLRWADGAGWRHAVAVGAWSAVAVLAKFAAAAPLLLILAAAVMAIPSWRARATGDRRTWAAASVVFVFLAVPWFVLQTARYGFAVWGWMLGHHVLTRFASSVDPGHVQSWWYYLEFLGRAFRGTWPYVLAGAAALFWSRGKRPALAVLGLWFAVPVALFSIATSKQVHYVYPALPPLAVMGGQAFGAVVALIRGGRNAGGRARLAAWVLIVAVLILDVGREYGRALAEARKQSRPLGVLADCVRARFGRRPRVFHLHSQGELRRDEKYYLARMGNALQPQAPRDGLSARLSEPGAWPEVAGAAEYALLSPTLAAWPAEARAAVSVAAIPGHELVVFLPGDFRPCADAMRRSP